VINKDFKIPDLKFKVDRIPKYVPTVNEILSIRAQKYQRLIHALVFELLLSTGLRSNELRQVRAEDITFDDIPYDFTDKMKSRYVGGSIKVYISRSRLKGKISRKTYFSILASKLLKFYMELNRIPFKSEIPLFPYTEKMFGEWLEKLTCSKITGDNITSVHSVTNRDENLTDVDETKYDGINQELLDAIRRRKNRDKSKTNNQFHQDKTLVVSSNISQRKIDHVSPHSLRHFFTCLMYFRNYHGEKYSKIRLMEYLGHSTEDMYLTYLSKLDLINSNTDWVKVLCGTSRDWNNLILDGRNKKKEIKVVI